MGYLDKVIHDLVQREGGFVNKKSDRGGPTKYGITQATLQDWRKKKVTIQDVIDLPLAEAEEIYLEWYVKRPGYLAFDDEPLAEQLIDAGVNHGCGTAIKMLQRAVGVNPDGGIGPQTIAAVMKLKKVDVFIGFMGQRLAYYANPCLKHESQWEYAQGWMNRCIALCKSYMAAADLTPPQKAFLIDATGVMKQTSMILAKKTNRKLSQELFNKMAKLFLDGRH